MDKENRLQVGDYVRHFKNKYYKILLIAINATNGADDETLVIYQALYGDYKIYAREYNEFMSEVDRAKYPEIKQKYRMEKASMKEIDDYFCKNKILIPEFVHIYKKEENDGSNSSKK